VDQKSTQELLKEREEQYGCATAQHNCAENIATVLENYTRTLKRAVLPADMFTCRMLALKITRMISNPKHMDNYDDIMGYTELMKRRYESE